MRRKLEGNTAGSGGAVIKPAHGRGMIRPWAPGQSGNPSGANGYNRMVALLREDSYEAAQELIRLRKSEDDRVRLMAVEAALNRAWGKPKERVEPDVPAKVFDPSKLTKAEKELLRNMLDKSFVKAPDERPPPVEIEGSLNE